MLPDDVERAVDLAYDVGLAVVTRNALPDLIREVWRLQTEFTKAVKALSNMLALQRGIDPYADEPERQ